MKRFLPLLSFLFSFPIFSAQLALDAKRESQTPIKRLQIFSQRCSGSNYITALLIQHFDFENCYNVKARRIPQELQEIEGPIQFYALKNQGKLQTKLFLYPYGHKHFSPWFCLTEEAFNGPKKFYTFEGSDDCLFMVVFRNPYDWLRSLYQSPWAAAPEIKTRSFKEFIHLPWDIDMTDPDMQVEYRYNHWVDHNPSDGSLFKNIFELRNYKLANMLSIKERVKNIYFVNYEKVLKDPEGFIKEIAFLYGLKMKQDYHNVDAYKGDTFQGQYVKKEYVPLSEEDLHYINSQLDPEQEAAIGYPLLDKLPADF